jgi:hypothetical protein
VLGIIARKRGRDEEALSLIEDAMDLTDASEDAVLAAQLRCERGELARASGDNAGAARFLAEAGDIYRKMGAARQLAAVERKLAGLRA